MLQVSWTRQAILAVLLFVFGMTAYWYEYRRTPEVESKKEQERKIFQLKETQVQSIRLAAPGRAFEMKCSDIDSKLCKSGDNSKWEITDPAKLRGDDANINSLLSTLTNISSTETIDLAPETPEKRASLLKDYGLDAASRQADGLKSVRVRTATGEQVLYLGQAHPIGENIFGLRGDGKTADENRVLMVPNYFKANLEKELTHWRNKKLLTVGSHEIVGLKIQGSKGALSAEKKDGRWTLWDQKKEEYPGDQDNIDTLLSALTFLSAKEFASEQKKDPKAKAALAGAKPLVTLTFQKDKGSAKETPEPMTLTILKKAKPEKLFATVSNLDPLFELEANAAGKLDKEIKDLRLVKLITSMERFTIKRLELSGKGMGEKLVFTNTDGKWTSPAKVDVDGEKIQKFLDKLQGNRIKEFLAGPQIPSGEKEGVIIAIGDDKQPVQKQFVFWKKDNSAYARDSLSKRKNEAFLIDNELKDGLPWERGAFLKGGPAIPPEVKSEVKPGAGASPAKPVGLPKLKAPGEKE